MLLSLPVVVLLVRLGVVVVALPNKDETSPNDCSETFAVLLAFFEVVVNDRSAEGRRPPCCHDASVAS